jgi:hypothetical protein
MLARGQDGGHLPGIQGPRRPAGHDEPGRPRGDGLPLVTWCENLL